LVLSNNQINKAGKTLASWFAADRQERRSTQAVADEAFGVILDFRAAHQYPLTKASMGLRSMVATEGCPVEVSQRLKRVPTILDKIRRYPKMRLASMQDIGGCRAVLSDVDQVRRVERRLKRNRPPLRVSDYIATPKDSGYRGIHVVVDYDGRAIEVQLRTQVMHQWAITVERLSGRLQEDLKSSRGPAEILAYLSAASEAMAIEEAGGVVDQEFLTALEELRKKAVPFLSQGGGR
jgi:ppGpp synthetase/RelA/SpoT-type nucleotidyltranferase